MNNFDVAIIGAGVGGSFAAYKIVKDFPNTKVVLFDLGRPPMKRRRQLEGWLGCLPNSDGKLYQTDIQKVTSLIGSTKTKLAKTCFDSILSNIEYDKKLNYKSPHKSMINKLTKNNFELIINDYIQLYPKDIHMLSKFMSNTITDNIECNFDVEVQTITKEDGLFKIVAEENEYFCKKIIIATGRSGWRWAYDLFKSFDIISENNISKFGIRIELESALIKEFNHSACSFKNNNFEIGPLCWNGTTIPEDHVDMALSAFRSNENRWKTDKVSFNLISDQVFENKGFEQMDRLSKLTFVLTNDRIAKEKLSTLMAGKSKISIIPEYNWLIGAINELSEIIPDISSKAYCHFPTIIPTSAKIELKSNLESNIKNMFVIGENAGINGILSAALTGCTVANSVCEG